MIRQLKRARKLNNYVRSFLKSLVRNVFEKIQKNRMIIFYIFSFILGVVLIIVTFCPLNDTWTNISGGVGTGILTSLFVTILVNHENDIRSRNERIQNKYILLGAFVDSNIDIYEDMITRINKFIILTNYDGPTVYKLTENLDAYKEFEGYLKSIDFNATEREQLIDLFKFDREKIHRFSVELSQLSKQTYLLNGVLSKEEYTNLSSYNEIMKYAKSVTCMESILTNIEVNKDECINFLKMSVEISVKTLKCFPELDELIQSKESYIAEQIDELYYDEIVSRSEEYTEAQRLEYEAKEEYYEQHPGEWKALISEETDEDVVLKNLSACICGFSAYTIDDLLLKLDGHSPKVISFFKQENIRGVLCKNRKLRKVVVDKFGEQILE